MSARRFSRLQKATALVPLAILSAAWTANMADLMPNPAAVAVNETPSPATLPDGSPLPTAPLQAPASITAPDDHSQPAATKGRSGGDLISSVSATGIPAAALAAYQRATTVINDADPTCHLDWPLLAAIGRVESNHGRVGGSRLTAAGVATPAILGPALTGRHGTSRVADTDGGTYDGDRSVDRAVGPMQFIPSTWAIVGVDGDGDGKRDPQDINDAALATAVYLCSGSNLSSLAGQRAAVYRYNHSHPYVATVLGIAAAYRAGDYTSVQTDVVPGGDLIVPTLPEPIRVRPHTPKPAHHHSSPHPQAPTSGTSTIPAEKPPAAAGGRTNHAATSGQDQAGDTVTTANKTDEPQSGSEKKTAGSDDQSESTTRDTRPAAPVISSPAEGATLNTSTLTISGTGQPGATITVTITLAGTDLITKIVEAGNGNWSLPLSDLADGDYSVSVTQTDAEGNESEQATTSFVVDTPPDAPTFTGAPTVGGIKVSGSGEPEATVTVFINGKIGGTATVGPEGEWTVTLGTPLASADKLTATQTDAAGNASAPSEPVAVAAGDPAETSDGPSDAQSDSK